MLNKFFAKPLELNIGDLNLKFSSVADFEFSMAGRTAVPSKKITEMVKFSLDQLKKEAKTIKEIEKKFVAILSRSIEEPGSINRAMRELDPLIFSQDHGWRDIIGALKYMQYLSSRQEIIKYLYSERKKFGEPGKETDATESSKLKDTLILENTIFEPGGDDKREGGFERMPKGEAVTVTLRSGQEFVVMLSKHKCRLAEENGKIRFYDPDGRGYEMKKGRNIVGRDTVSTVMIEPSLRDVSRLHLVIEKYEDNVIQLIDMSSHGTSIPTKLLEHHSSW